MKSLAVAAAVILLSNAALTGAAWAKRDANDPRRICREAIQKANGLGKDAKVSRKDVDRCVANGGKL